MEYPNFGFKEIVKKKLLEKLGVKFIKDCVIGKIKSLDDLRREFNAVFLGLGAGTPLFLIFQRKSLRVYSANEYLTRVNLMKAYLFPEYDTPMLKEIELWCWEAVMSLLTRLEPRLDYKLRK